MSISEINELANKIDRGQATAADYAQIKTLDTQELQLLFKVVRELTFHAGYLEGLIT